MNPQYALGRSLSPALIAEYQARLQAKLHEFYLQNAPDDYPEDPVGISNSLVQKYRLSEKSSKLLTPLTSSKRENHVPNSSHSNRPGRLSWQAIHSGYSCASLHRCRQPGRRYVNRGCTTGIRFDSRRYPSCLGIRQRFGAAGIFP